MGYSRLGGVTSTIINRSRNLEVIQCHSANRWTNKHHDLNLNVVIMLEKLCVWLS